MSGIELVRVSRATTEVIAAVNRLLPQLRPGADAIIPEHLERLLASPSTHLYGAKVEGAFAGMLTLIVAPIPTGFHGYIEDVVVDDAYRGRGIAEHLVRAALDAARELGAEKVDLTSNPSREAANRLYVRIGFERRETNVYRFRLR